MMKKLEELWRTLTAPRRFNLETGQWEEKPRETKRPKSAAKLPPDVYLTDDEPDGFRARGKR